MSVVIRTRKNSDMLYLDIHYGSGKRTKRSTGLKDTTANRSLLLKEAIPLIEKQISEGLFDPNAKEKKVYLLEEYALLCFERHKNDRRKHVSEKLLSHFKKHIFPNFGKRRLDSIKPMELLDWQNEKLKTYKASTVIKFRSILNQIFEDALLEELIDKNPFIHVKKIKKQKQFNELEDNKIEPFLLNEIYELINKADGYLRNFIAIMTFTGARPGELIALEWNDIDFENQIININKTTIRGSDGLPKTKASVRRIEMLDIVKDYLMNQYALTGKIDKKVFLNSSNNVFYSHDIIGKRFKDLLDKDDKRYLYQLRHTFASLMINEGEDIVWVSQMMGHENIDITLKTYTHFYRLNQQKNDRKKRALFLENVSQTSHLNKSIA